MHRLRVSVRLPERLGGTLAEVARDENPRPARNDAHRALDIIAGPGSAAFIAGAVPFGPTLVGIGTGAARSGRISSIGIGNTIVEF
jgi:hypothetical protein